MKHCNCSSSPFRALFDVGLIKTSTGNRVFGALKTLNEDEPEKSQTHFREYVKKGVEVDDMEALYKKVHAAIRADPLAKKSEKRSLKELGVSVRCLCV